MPELYKTIQTLNIILFTIPYIRLIVDYPLLSRKFYFTNHSITVYSGTGSTENNAISFVVSFLSLQMKTINQRMEGFETQLKAISDNMTMDNMSEDSWLSYNSCDREDEKSFPQDTGSIPPSPEEQKKPELKFTVRLNKKDKPTIERQSPGYKFRQGMW